MKEHITYRNSELVNKAYKKLLIPDVITRLCGMVVTLADSLIAARFIGTAAVSAIALVAPFILFNECLHDLFASGTTGVLIKYKSHGQLREADRAFGAILINVFLWYVLIFGLASVFAEKLFRIFTSDSTLIADSIRYFLPIAVCQPFCELGLCFERGFKTDGRNGFFGVRGVLTNVLNIIFSVIAVVVFDGGILGISLASNLSTLLGYSWSFSHFFSKNCTIHPDFSILHDRAEMRGYLREEMAIGSVYALDDGLFAGASAVLSKAVIHTGGTAALTAVGICSAIMNIVYSVDGAVNGAAYSLCNLFYSDKDYKGSMLSLRSALIIEAVFGAAVWTLLNLFTKLVGAAYKVDSAEVMTALRFCLRFTTVTAIADCFTNLFSSFMLSTGKASTARIFSIVHNLLIFLSAFLGMTGISFSALLIANMISSVTVGLGEAIALAVSGKGLLEKNKAEIKTYSYVLKESSCAEISKKIAELVGEYQSLSRVSAKASLLAEECNRLILYVNRNTEKDISVDFRISVDEQECVITIVDTGELFDPFNRLSEGELPEELSISRQILKEFSPAASYARIINLNVSHLVIPLR